jgi:mannitol-specific phosphotransferase system IIBC component
VVVAVTAVTLVSTVVAYLLLQCFRRRRSQSVSARNNTATDAMKEFTDTEHDFDDAFELNDAALAAQREAARKVMDGLR